jgi:protein SCO1/2
MRRTTAALAALGACLTVVLAGCGASSGDQPPASITTTAAGGPFRGLAFPLPHPRPHFTLTDQQGRSYDFGARTAGRPTFLYFGYTHCPDVCPTTMADLATALRKLPAGLRDRVRVVFVTTDPKRDTPGVIGAWLANFDPDLTTKFVGLTGSQAGIDDAERAAGVPLAEDGGLTHSAQVLLYGRDDECRVFYVRGSSPDDIAHDVRLVA